MQHPADIILIDGRTVPNPEDLAMLQALYSRSSESVLTHLEKVKRVGSSNFMREHYVGYGHDSIGQCGDFVLFVEGASLLAAKVIQDDALYNGQETSTRYLPFSSRQYVLPVSDDRLEQIIINWLDFYDKILPILTDHLMHCYPYSQEAYPDFTHDEWYKAIRARVFDIARGYLPAAMKTQLSWKSSISQCAKRLISMYFHPLKEMKDISCVMSNSVRTNYPSSFGNLHSRADEAEAHLSAFAIEYNYFDPFTLDRQQWPYYDSVFRGFDDLGVDEALHGLTGVDSQEREPRPRNLQTPRLLKLAGDFLIKFTIDYGTFRDIQRHRDCYIPLPILSPFMGFNQWYIDNLPAALQAEARTLIDAQTTKLASALADGELDRVQLQYYTAIGYNVPGLMKCDLRQLIYIAEQRTSRYVHPILRPLAHRMGQEAMQHTNLQIHLDFNEDKFCVGRGRHDIINLEEGSDY
jgi:hypothetical protein